MGTKSIHLKKKFAIPTEAKLKVLEIAETMFPQGNTSAWIRWISL